MTSEDRPHGKQASSAPSPAAVKAMLADGEELALIDVREELIFSQRHLLWARSVPLSRLELRFARLVPRRATRIVLCDDDDGLVERAADDPCRAPATPTCRYLDGGVAGLGAGRLRAVLRRQRAEQGVRRIRRARRGTPSIGASELDGADAQPAPTWWCSTAGRSTNTSASRSRPRSTCRAPSWCCACAISRPSPDTLIVVNCAGRTRSIIGAQSLINAGVPNKVVALRNGTMGWHLAGLDLRQRQDQARADASADGLAWAKAAAASVAPTLRRRAHRPRHARSAGAPTRRARLYRLRRARSGRIRGRPSARRDVGARRPTGAGDRPICRHAAAPASCWSTTTRCARVMTASWLKQMGWKDVFVLPEAGQESTRPAGGDRCSARRRRRGAPSTVSALLADRRRDRHRPFAQPGLSQGPHSRRLVCDPLAARPRLAENPAARRRWCSPRRTACSPALRSTKHAR